jgi:hypothetical protein
VPKEEQAVEAQPTAKLSRAAAAAAALAALTLIVAACGSGDDETSASQMAAERQVELTGGGRTGRGSPANPPPKGASPFVKELYREFPPPEPQPGVRGAAAAIRAGEEACAGKTPLEVKEAFLPAAVESGRLDSESRAMIARTGEFEERIAREPSFTSGQLAAAAYQATLPQRLASSGFQGCIYAMAKDLERRVSGEK